MKIEFTKHYLKDFQTLTDKKQVEAVNKVVKTVEESPNFLDLMQKIDIKKYNKGLGGYRIRFSNNPEMRIRFELENDNTEPTGKKLKFQICLPREKYEKYAHVAVNINENEEKGLKVKLTEEQMQVLKIYLNENLI